MQSYFLYIFLQAEYIVPPGAHMNVAHQLLFLRAIKFIAYTYYVLFF